MLDEKLILGNGIVAESGDYSTTFDRDELYEILQKEHGLQNEQESRFMKAQTEGRHAKTLGTPPEITPHKLDEARWGIIWPPPPLTEEELEHKDALQSLIEHRRTQLKGKPEIEFNYQNGWAYDEFLWSEEREIEPGNMDVNSVPYYLLIVGPPERIPWEFQQYLDGEYAVGRLWFDKPEDCFSYIDHLITYEKKVNKPANAREVLLFGPNNENDQPTRLSAEHLVEPLHNWLVKNPDFKNFQKSLLLGDLAGQKALKTNLMKRLSGESLSGDPDSLPALLFTASHGLETAKPSDSQYDIQGALICQEWQRPKLPLSLSPSVYLTGDEIGEDLDLGGMMTFCFACYSAGTPLKQDWVRETMFKKPTKIADRPFVARLPQKMLARGALAFIGHVSKTWLWSFMGSKASKQHLGSFTAPMGELLHGLPVGHATDYLNERWVHLSNQLELQLSDKKKYGKEKPITTWMVRNDVRGYVILGDPAARLRVADLL